ncbi:MAG: hypothetical protein JW869_00495 [Candidatus Omnitrophica bacterium]|nr:hypothetical protein [Candidatus Omnitrophota bacterium]
MGKLMKALTVFTIIVFAMSSSFVYADPPEGKGKGRNNGKAYGKLKVRDNGSNKNKVNQRGVNTAPGQAKRAEALERDNNQSAIRAEQIERNNIPGLEKRNARAQARAGKRTGQDNLRGKGAAKKLHLARLQNALDALHGKEHARWNNNPNDERGQGNNGKPDMRDPYGHSKDDRKEETGNRGRPIREIIEIPESYFRTDYLYVDHDTYWAAYFEYYGIYSAMYNFDSLGYSEEESDLLRSMTLSEVRQAMITGYILGDTLEYPILSSADGLDLSNVVDYADAYEYVYLPGETVEYDVMLTNPYDTSLDLSLTVTVEYMNNEWVYNPDSKTYYRQSLVGEALEGESTQVWDTLTLAPAENITLYDTYFMPLEVGYGDYQFDLTLTDLSSGLTYTDPRVGWFDPPLI